MMAAFKSLASSALLTILPTRTALRPSRTEPRMTKILLGAIALVLTGIDKYSEKHSTRNFVLQYLRMDEWTFNKLQERLNTLVIGKSNKMCNQGVTNRSTVKQTETILVH